MILLILVYLSLGSSFALPTPSDLSANVSPSVFARSADRFDTRSIGNIISSCIATLFACIWIAIHPNIPAPEDSHWAVLRRRVTTMVYVLIFPELVICWAARQHFGARHLAKKYQKHGWTMVHGFFIIMGGFTLHDSQGKPLQILEPDELETLYEAKKIAWPAITEQEIQDRSKGDYLSKTIVLGHTSWFIAQCILRGVAGLAVTELEVATLAFAALTGMTYYLWWHKPLDVRCSVPVYLLNLHEDENGEMIDSESTLSGSSDANPLSASRPTSYEPIEELDANFNPQQPRGEENQTLQQSLVPLNPEPDIGGSDSMPTPLHNNTLATPFLLHPIFVALEPCAVRTDSNTLHDSSPLRVPTFYFFKDSTNNYGFFLYAAGCVAVGFGSIHCIAWSFQFPSPQEQLMWRISAACVTGLPVFIFPCMVFFHLPQGEQEKILGFTSLVPLVHTVALVVSVVYVVARLVLLVLACITLRALPPTAFTQIAWVSYVPHIG